MPNGPETFVALPSSQPFGFAQGGRSPDRRVGFFDSNPSRHLGNTTPYPSALPGERVRPIHTSPGLRRAVACFVRLAEGRGSLLQRGTYVTLDHSRPTGPVRFPNLALQNLSVGVLGQFRNEIDRLWNLEIG